MLKHDSKHKRLGWFLFIVYLLLVIYLMFFSEELGRTAHELSLIHIYRELRLRHHDLRQP